jgi:hypothetical protein
MVNVQTILCHHTAGPKNGELPSLATVRDGRPDLAGPLAHLMLGRSGTVYVIAAGLCWHAGIVFDNSQANEHAIGIEAEATGVDAWPLVQYDAYARLTCGLAKHYRLPISRILGHKEVASPRGRKSDPNFDMPAFRSKAANTPPPGAAVPASTASTGEPDMNIPVTYYAVDAAGAPTVPDPAGTAFRASMPCEVGAGSQVVAASWVRWTAKWGTATFRIVFWDATHPIAEADTAKQDWWQIPAAARSFTIEGVRQHAGVQIGASLLSTPH